MDGPGRVASVVETGPVPCPCRTMTAVPSDLMNAAIYQGDGRIAVGQVPVPEPAPGELLVEVADCGICGSDLHLVFGKYATPGAILGHEWSGTVVAGNGEVTSRPAGTRIVSSSSPGCGTCRPCRRGRPSVCVRRPASDMRDIRGAFARYIVVDEAGTLVIPDSLDLRAAALAEPTAIALHAVALAGVDAHDRVLVTGGGPIGLIIVSVLVTMGVKDITVSEPSGLRRERPAPWGRHVPPARGSRVPPTGALCPNRWTWPSSAPGAPGPGSGPWPTWTVPGRWSSWAPEPNRCRSTRTA